MDVNWKATGLLVIDVGDGIELNIRAVSGCHTGGGKGGYPPPISNFSPPFFAD